MNRDFIKQKFFEGQNTEYTHMIILKDKYSSNLYCIYVQKESTTFETIQNFLTDKTYDYIILFSLKHDIDMQLKHALEEFNARNLGLKDYSILETPKLKLFI